MEGETRMRTRTRIVSVMTMTVVLTVGTALIGSAATLAPPVSASVAKADSRVVSMDSYSTDLFAKDFVLTGTRIMGNRKVGPYESLARKGTTIRFSTIKNGSTDSVITTTDGKVTCERTSTPKLPDNTKGDLKARWNCKKGTSKTINTELGLFEPSGMIALMNRYFVNDAGFQVYPAPYADKGSIRIRVYDNKGHIAGVFEYTKTISVPYSGTMLTPDGKTPISSFSVSKGANDKVVPISKLKKKYAKKARNIR